MPANLENSVMAIGLEKVSFHSNSKEGILIVKECLNFCTITLISHDSKVMHKILQAKLQQYVNQELPDVQDGFCTSHSKHPPPATQEKTQHIDITRWSTPKSDCLEQAEEPEITLPTFTGSYRKQGNYKKASTSASLTTQKFLTVWITTSLEYQTTSSASWEFCMQVKKQQLEPQMEQWTGLKLVKEWRLCTVTLLIQLICRVHYMKCWSRWSAAYLNQQPQICRWRHP